MCSAWLNLNPDPDNDYGSTPHFLNLGRHQTPYYIDNTEEFEHSGDKTYYHLADEKILSR